MTEAGAIFYLTDEGSDGHKVGKPARSVAELFAPDSPNIRRQMNNPS